jgi:hypothetical protein
VFEEGPSRGGEVGGVEGLWVEVVVDLVVVPGGIDARRGEEGAKAGGGQVLGVLRAVLGGSARPVAIGEIAEVCEEV